MGENQSREKTSGCACNCADGSEGGAQHLGSLQLHVLRAGGDSVEILKRGAAVLSWRFRDGRQLLDGYQSEREALELEGYRNAVLAPWSNRIKDATFEFEGKVWDQGVDPSGIREALHGRIATLDFEVTDEGDSAQGCPVELETQGAPLAWVRLSCDLPAAPSYPWPLSIEVVYVLVAGETSRLTLRASARNRAEGPAPVTLGWHPYLRHQGDPQQTRVRVRAHSAIKTAQDNIPLPGADAFVSSQGLDVRGPSQMDDAFTQLVADEDGLAGAVIEQGDGSVMTLRAALATGRRGCGIVHVFTGECLPSRGGQALAVEPCLMMTDAFNRAECAEAVPLQPGQTRRLQATLEFTPPKA